MICIVFSFPAIVMLRSLRALTRRLGALFLVALCVERVCVFVSVRPLLRYRLNVAAEMYIIDS